MFEFLDNLRAKSPFVRQQIAIGIAGVFSLVVFFVWMGTWGIKNDPPPIANAQAESPGTVLLDTIGELKDGGVEAWKETMSAVGGISDVSQLAGVLSSASTSEANTSTVIAHETEGDTMSALPAPSIIDDLDVSPVNPQ